SVSRAWRTCWSVARSALILAALSARCARTALRRAETPLLRAAPAGAAKSNTEHSVKTTNERARARSPQHPTVTQGYLGARTGMTQPTNGTKGGPGASSSTPQRRPSSMERQAGTAVRAHQGRPRRAGTVGTRRRGDRGPHGQQG